MSILRSNKGKSELEIELIPTFDYAHERGWEGKVRVSGSFWDGDHDRPVGSEMEGLWIHAETLRMMQKHLKSWISLPLSELGNAVLQGEFELARIPGQKFLLVFGEREDTINSGHPVVSIELQVGSSHQVKAHFVTDQSCLRLFVEELKLETILK
ncbi:MAG: hypothetical protein AAF733_13530 [Verrucomicrobiota bacterium]